jgi:hypothetical protein
MRYGKKVTLRETRQTGTGFTSRIRRIRRLDAFLPGGATGFCLDVGVASLNESREPVFRHDRV